jgi:hypothetical protein
LTGDRGKCLVLRLLYSYMARGTAMKKRVWSYASGSAAAPGASQLFQVARGEFLPGLDNHANGLPPVR